jgi:hypothetical protein
MPDQKTSVYSQIIATRETLRASPELEHLCNSKFLGEPMPEPGTPPVVRAAVMWPQHERNPSWNLTPFNQWGKA